VIGIGGKRGGKFGGHTEKFKFNSPRELRNDASIKKRGV
jgi:hypothetical protein